MFDAYDAAVKLYGKNHELTKWFAMKLERCGWKKV